MLVECLVGNNSLSNAWSSEVCANNFRESYKVFEGDSIVSRVGCNKFWSSGKERILHWEAAAGIVCLREKCLDGPPLPNSCVCVRLGASELLEMNVFSPANTASAGQQIVLCFVQEDGAIHVLELRSDISSSILDTLVVSNEGGLVNLGGTVSSEIPFIGLANRRHHELKGLSAKAGGSSLTAYSGSVQSLPADRDIESAVWASAECLLLGLSHGDVLLVQLSRRQAGGSTSLQLREHVLRDRGSGLKAMWSEFMGGAADSNCDTICLAAQAASALAVNRSGELRQWNIESEALVSQTSLFDLLDAVGAVSGLVAGRAGASTQSSPPGQSGTIDRNIHLQDCVVRLGRDGGSANNNSQYLLGALAVLPEECTGAGGSGSGSGLTGRAVPSTQQRWQILLVAWKEASEASMRPSEKVKLVAQPIKFPVGSLVVGPNQSSADPALVGYRYSAAALVDLHLAVDSVRGEATVVSVWRVAATRRTSAGEDSVELEGLVCRSVLQLADLRAQDYTPPGPTGAGPRRTEELAAASEMQMVLHSAAHDRLRMLAEDRAVLHMAEEAWAATDLSDQKALLRAESQLKTSLLQRVFLPHRYSGRAICSACDVFRARNKALLPDEAALLGGRGVEESKSAWIATAALDKQTPMTELPHLVLLLCEGAAKMKFNAAGAAVLGLGSGVTFAPHRAGLEGQELRWRQQFLQYLSESFSGFLGDCETFSRRMDTLNAGCTVCVARRGGDVAVKALRDGDIALISAGSASSERHFAGEEGEAAMELMLAIEERFTSDDALRQDFLELDCLMDKYLQAGDISEASAEWVPHFFASLAPGLRCLLPQLLNLLQSEGNGDLSCYDALVSHCSLPDELPGLLSAGNGLFDSLLGLGARDSSAASAISTPSDVAVLYEHALRSARLYLQRSKLVLALLSLVVEVGQPLLSADTYSAIRNKHIPMVVQNVLHFSLLLWLDARRPTDNHMLVHEVELASIFPLSAIMSTSSASENSAVTSVTRTRSPAVSKPDGGASVLENFVRHLHNDVPAAETFTQSILRFFSAVRLSAHSELTRYLFQSGQYVGLSRWASLTQLVQAPFALSASHIDKRSSGGVEELLVSVGRCRIRITKLTAEYLELLRCQWYHLQRTSHSAAASSGPLSAIKMKVHELLAATQELNTLADSALSSANHTGDTTLSPVAGDRRRTLAAADIAQGIVRHLRSEWGTSAANLRALGAHMSQWQTKAYFCRLEGMVALADAAMYVGTIGKGASMLCVLADSPAALGQDAESAVRDLVVHRMSELCRTLHLSSMSSVLEMLDRALFFLPRKEGSALAMDGALRLADHVAGTLDAVTQRSGLDRQSCSQILLAELHGAWSRVFEYALLHGERYTEALDALLRVAELEEQRLLDADALSAAAAVPWRGCLRTLVAQACDMGQLGWLCSIPDRQLQGFAKQGFSLCAAIASTLEELAVTLDTPSSMNFNEANYFECLFVFHLSRHNYHDAARVMHKLLERKTAAGLSVELEAQVGYSAASLASLAALPENQRFVLHKLTGRDCTGSSVSGMQCLDERQLSMLFAKKRSACKLASSAVGTPVGQMESAEHLVVALCNAGSIHDALSLAWTSTHTAANSGDNFTSAAPGECLASIPVIALAKQCIMGGPNESAERDFFLRAPFHAGSAPSSEQPAKQQWRQLISLLNSLHRTGSSQHLYEVALRALLFFHRQHSEAGSAPVPLPRSLVDALAGLPSPVSADPAERPVAAPTGDPALLLRMLVEFDSREEACLLATRLLRAANEQLQLQAPERRGSNGCCGWMPYPTLDQLIAHCATPHLGTSAEQQQRERVALDGLTGALEQHFSLWLFH